ncbi:DUF4225 domain-containing protein [Serratia fonticola]|uniref:DUF4225 domain-containing protein n=1 Tax=Serratia fonticola TaxID=47917 RepID=UPI0015C5E8D6|nr:DUF4225 domain-containing protein [Serratia fonticola]MBC3379780.1 DUF4225 domain-containing protein [Serratia fonticola]NYA38979.1 DUF4225 domain-containing protein [Serratia fonticola]
MDNYFGFREQVKNYYLEMALANSHELGRLANRASAFYLKNAQSRFSFQKEIDDLINHHISTCRAATTQEGQRNAFVCLKAEHDSLRMQYESLQLNKVARAVYLEIKKENGVYTYVVKAIGVVAGLSQVASGLAMVLASEVTFVSGVTGVLLICHGANNIYENLQFFFTGEENTGYLRDLYRWASTNVGYGERGGDILYAGIDLSLSLKALFGKVVVPNSRSWLGISGRGPDTERLYYAMYNDAVTGFKTMGKFSLSLEIVSDAITIKGVMK